MEHLSSTTKLRPIRSLPDHVVNQIAAGEVVERPASVVKELVENSLDAGARHVEVHLIGGGMDEIVVLDNGNGIRSEELPLAIARFATSKIENIDDLVEVGSFGFRGEALSSIASVSELEIRSRTAESQHGFRLGVEYGEQDAAIAPCASPTGTRITVKNLFSRVPARRKFLRSAATELAHVSRTFKEIALGHPEAKFTLSHQGRQLQKYVAPTRAERLSEVLKWKWNPLRIQQEAEGVVLDAFCSPPHELTEKGEFLLYINGRCVQHRALASVVRNAYAQNNQPLPSPRVVLFLEIEPSWLDVNVHPQKLEVRLWKQERILSWIRATLRKELALFETHHPAETLPRPFPPPVFAQNGSLDFGTTPHLFAQTREGRWLGEDSEGVFWLDPHLAEESFLFESWSSHSDKLPSVALTPPFRFRTNKLTLFLSHSEILERLGFRLQDLGSGDGAFHTAPAGLRQAALEKVLDALEEILGTSLLTDWKSVLTRLACAGAYERSTPLDRSSAEAFLRRHPAKADLTCPHGHPILFRIPLPPLGEKNESC